MINEVDPLDEFRVKMCGHKRGYTTNKEARRVRKLLKLKNSKEKMDIYHCPFCGYHHLGHRMPPERAWGPNQAIPITSA